MSHIKKFNEGWDKNRTIWSKDNDIARKVLKNINSAENISKVENESTYNFKLIGFDFEIEWDCDMFDFIHPSGYYIIKCDGVILDIGYILSKKIYKSIESMYEKDSKDLESHIKKDIRLSLKS